MINDFLVVVYFIDRSICKGFELYVEVVEDGIVMG